MKKYFIVLIIAVFAFPSVALSAGTPLDAIQTNINQVLDVLSNPKLKSPSAEEIKKEKLRAIYKVMFDEIELSKRSLGMNWNKLTADERQEFIKLYRQILEKAYIDRILSYTNEKIVFNKKPLISADLAEVQTKIVTSSREIPIDYRVILTGGAWKVYDVVIENVSLVENYRSQFNDILANNTPEQLLLILQNKVKEQ
ncbi:MAG: phospholipid-binding protein MlaC [Syntrophales bacterium]